MADLWALNELTTHPSTRGQPISISLNKSPLRRRSRPSEILAVLETSKGAPPKKVRPKATKQAFSLRSYKEALEVFKELDGVKAIKTKPDKNPLEWVPPGEYSATVRVFSTSNVQEFSDDPPTPLFYVIEYDNEEIKEWRQEQEQGFSDIAEFMKNMPYGTVLGVWNAEGEAEVASLGTSPGFIASVELQDQTADVSFLLATWPVSEGFVVAVLRSEEHELMARMVGSAWPTETKTVKVSYGE
jgi:hypothetical protein